MFEFVEAELHRVEEVIQEFVSEVDNPLLADFYRVFLQPDGTRIRPLLVFLTARVAEYDPERALLWAISAELSHIAIMIHEEIERAPEQGRSKISTARPKLRDSILILAGDNLFAKSAALIADLEDIRLSALSSETLQSLSMTGLKRIQVPHDWDNLRNDYYSRVRSGSAKLFATCAEGGAVLSQVPNRLIEALRTYGLHLGIAFQIMNEVQDCQRELEVVDSFAGNDWHNGVVTMPLVCLVERLIQEDDRESLSLVKRVINQGDDVDLATIIKLIEDFRCCEAARRDAQDCITKARISLMVLPASESHWALTSLADEVLRIDSGKSLFV